MDIKEIDILGDNISTHWYYKSKANAIQYMLTGTRLGTILDVGAGSGFFSQHLLANTDAKEAWCVDTSYTKESDQHVNGKLIHYRKEIQYTLADIVLVMDVLEHVDNDILLLQEYISKIPSGTKFLITVPAFQFLWSDHDIFLEHQRRYSLKYLENIVQKSGLTIHNGCYYFGSVFLIAAILRSLQKFIRTKSKSQLSRHSNFINNILSFVCAYEIPIMKYNRFVGLTACCIGKK